MSGDLTPELLLSAYASGIFPMSESREDDQLFWMDPCHRGIFELDNFNISRSLAKFIRRESFQIRINFRFSAVVEGCADRNETWINAPLLDLYQQLHEMGFAQSLEIWDGKDLVGGVFGITLGGAFFGESMFSRRTNASKVALAYLIDRLRAGGFCLFDTQFITPHLASLGAIEISREDYRQRLALALDRPADFFRQVGTPSAHSVLQRMTQTS